MRDNLLADTGVVDIMTYKNSEQQTYIDRDVCQYILYKSASRLIDVTTTLFRLMLAGPTIRMSSRSSALQGVDF